MCLREYPWLCVFVWVRMECTEPVVTSHTWNKVVFHFHSLNIFSHSSTSPTSPNPPIISNQSTEVTNGTSHTNFYTIPTAVYNSSATFTITTTKILFVRLLGLTEDSTPLSSHIKGVGRDVWRRKGDRTATGFSSGIYGDRIVGLNFYVHYSYKFSRVLIFTHSEPVDFWNPLLLKHCF